MSKLLGKAALDCTQILLSEIVSHIEHNLNVRPGAVNDILMKRWFYLSIKVHRIQYIQFSVKYCSDS